MDRGNAMEIADELKQAYKTFIAPSDLWDVNLELNKVIMGYKPESVLEFGCGTGKNLLLFDKAITTMGIDISQPAVAVAQLKGVCAVWDDETRLKYMDSKFDVVFTCSVLNHMPEVGPTIANLKRIANKAVILCETLDIVEWNYFRHDYESYGFQKLDYEWVSFNKGQRYNIWVYEK